MGASFAYHLSVPRGRGNSRFLERLEMRLKLRFDPAKQLTDAIVVLL
jgi:hypothetical protein